MLVSPLGSAQSPKRNLQLAASLQPTEEGGPFSAGLGRSPGSASAGRCRHRAQPAPLRGSCSLAQRVLLIAAEGSTRGKRAELGPTRRRDGSGRDSERPGCWESVIV